MIHLELFKGTGSFSKVSEQLNFTVISVDILQEFHPTILCNILELNYKELPIPDIITASVPCTSFSTIGVNTRKYRCSKTMQPLHQVAFEGDKLLDKTIEIIQYFQARNPSLKWIIENPHGFLYKDARMKGFKRTFSHYGCYDWKFLKPTDIFHNFENLKLRSLKTHKSSHSKSICKNTSTLLERYAMPPMLCKDIFEQFLVEFT